MIIEILAIIICSVVTTIWYYVSKEYMAPKFSNTQHIWVFIAGLFAITILLVLVLVLNEIYGGMK